MPRPTAVLREKEIDEGGNIVELVVWRVPVYPFVDLDRLFLDF